MTYDQWFRSQQGIPYEGMYLFAEAAWEHQQKQIATLTRQRDLAVEALKQILADDYENDFLSFDLFDMSNKTISTIKESEGK